MQSTYDKGCDELMDESMATNMCAMQSTYEKGCDELTDDSGATDICAHCAADDKLQPALYFCFHCGPFGRYMCGDCNKQHTKFAFQHDARSISTATLQKREKIKRRCNKATDESGAIDICAFCASENKIEPAFFFRFDCGPFGRYTCWFCIKEIKMSDREHNVRSVAEALTPSETRFFMVAAIDIGTTNSGYAFSTNEDFCKDPSKIYTHHWIDGNSVPLTWTPTCVLFDKNKKFHSFGLDAEDNYRELAWDGEQKAYYFFRRFKRTLFDEMQPKRKLMLEDETGKSMDAMDVFSACIKYLREHLMDTFLKKLPDMRDNDIRWMLTLPGFCNEASKEFMRESAQKAGIHRERLLIAMEPEAAITFARNLPVKISTEPDGRFKPFAAKSDYLGVFDAGGYTIKITVHEVKQKRAVKQLYKTSVLNLGSTNIDKAFRDFLAAIVGNDIMDDFQHNNMLDYNDMLKRFELKRRLFKNDMTEKIILKVPISLIEMFEKAKGKRIKDHLLTKPEYNGKVHWVGDKLRIDPNIVKGLFRETFDKVARHLKSLFSKPEFKDVQNILMVGAFSESLSLQDFIIKTFPNRRIIIPEDASLSVLKGAVILGHVW